MAETLEQVLVDLKSDVPVLRRHGATVSLDEYDAAIARVARAAEPFTTWLSEGDAILKSGHRVEWFRSRRERWAALGHARQGRGGKWEYRDCIVPQRVDLDAVRADAERAARGEDRAATTAGVAG